MRKLSLILVAAVLGTASIVSATSSIPYSVEEFLNRGTRFGVGYLQKDGKNFYKAALSNDFKAAGFTVGMDANLYLPSDSNNGSAESTFTVRKLGYEYKDVFGAEWGRLTHLTLGQGLLVNDYDSGSGGNSYELTPQRAGLKGFVNVSNFKLEGFTTARSLFGGRASYRLDKAAIGLPLEVGGTYAKDPNGGFQNAGQAGYAFDLSSPIGSDFFVPYVEYAKLEKHGQGFGTGVRGGFLSFFNYRVEYRSLSSRFAPGYFNSTYENAPISIETSPSKTGFLGMIGSSWFDNYVQTEVQVESYSNSESLITGGLGFKPLFGMAAVAHYTQPIQGNTAPMLTAEALLFSVGPMETLVGLRQVYRDSGTETSYTFGATVSLTKMMGLPF